VLEAPQNDETSDLSEASISSYLLIDEVFTFGHLRRVLPTTTVLTTA
jgi:hypothetical protein